MNADNPHKSYLPKNQLIALVRIISTGRGYILDEITDFLLIRSEVHPLCVICLWFILIVAMCKHSNTNAGNLAKQTSSCFFHTFPHLS